MRTSVKRLIGLLGLTFAVTFAVLLLPVLTTRAAAQLHYSQPIMGTLTAGQSTDYTFSGKAGDKPVIAMNARGGNLSPKISLFDPQGRQIGEDSGSGGKGNALLKGTVLAASGTYKVTVANTAQSDSGTYTLVINEEKRQLLYENDQPGTSGVLEHYQLTQRWNHTNITYSIANSLSQFNTQDVNNTIAQAFQSWANVTPLTFTQVNGRGDINIKFAPIDGPYNILGETCPPGETCQGDVTFDSAEPWTLGNPDTVNDSNISLLGVASHEFGHAVGLLHTTDSTALMYPEYSPYVLQPAADDVSGVQRLYGPGGTRISNPTPAPDVPTPIDTSSGQNVVTGALDNTRFAHFWDFDVNAGATATITMTNTSGNLDAFLMLVDAQNHVLAWDDDSGGGKNAQLRNIHFPTAGTYSVIATRYEQAQGFTTGSYSLSIQYGELPTVTAPVTTSNPTSVSIVPTVIFNGNTSGSGNSTTTSGSAMVGGVTVSSGSSTQFGQLPTLESKLSSPFAISANPGKQTRSGTISRSQSYTWDLQWCANNAQTLATDQGSLTPSFSINNQQVSSSTIATANSSVGGQSCVTYYVVLSSWPSGSDTLIATLTLKQPVYDGQTIFPQGNYVYEADLQAN